MGIALTIGIMLIIESVIILIRDNGPYTFLDDIEGKHYLFLGVIIIINVLIHYLLK